MTKALDHELSKYAIRSIVKIQCNYWSAKLWLYQSINSLSNIFQINVPKPTQLRQVYCFNHYLFSIRANFSFISRLLALFSSNSVFSDCTLSK